MLIRGGRTRGGRMMVGRTSPRKSPYDTIAKGTNSTGKTLQGESGRFKKDKEYNNNKSNSNIARESTQKSPIPSSASKNMNYSEATKLSLEKQVDHKEEKSNSNESEKSSTNDRNERVKANQRSNIKTPKSQRVNRKLKYSENNKLNKKEEIPKNVEKPTYCHQHQ